MKRPKPNKNRPQAWATIDNKTGKTTIRIVYPGGKTECLHLFKNNHHNEWFVSKLLFDYIKDFDHYYGKKTHFLGNL